MATAIKTVPTSVSFAPPLPTWISRSCLNIWDDNERQDWPFEVTIVPGCALTEAERKTAFREFKGCTSRVPEDNWSVDWIFSHGYETLFAVRGKSGRQGATKSKITAKNLIGVVSFSRGAEWDHEIGLDEDEPVPSTSDRVLHLQLEPQLIYVKPEYRGLRMGYALMHVLADVFRSDLERCVAARPDRVDCFYEGQYHSRLGEKVGGYCVEQIELGIDVVRGWLGWLAPIGDLEVDGGM